MISSIAAANPNSVNLIYTRCSKGTMIVTTWKVANYKRADTRPYHIATNSE